MVKELDGRRMTTRDAAHDELSRVLELPAYYGRNLDALWDLVSTMEARVTLSHREEMIDALGLYGQKLLNTLRDAARENPDFHFTVKRQISCQSATERYYSALVGEDIASASYGTTFLASPLRDEAQKGYGRPADVLVWKQGDKLIVSYGRRAAEKVQSLYAKLHCRLSAPEIAQVLSEVYGAQAHHSVKYLYMGDGEGGGEAVTLTAEQYGDFLRFFMEANGESAEPDWLKEYFLSIVAKRACCGVYRDGRLVCCTDAPDMPFLPEKVQELGIHTLSAHRGQGLAQAACRRAIREQLAQGKCPLWSAGGGNIPSQRLAESLGFEKLADSVAVTLE